MLQRGLLILYLITLYHIFKLFAAYNSVNVLELIMNNIIDCRNPFSFYTLMSNEFIYCTKL